MIRILHSLWSIRFAARRWGTPLLIAWNLLAGVLVLLAPPQFMQGHPFWTGTLASAGLALVMAAAFLAFALWLAIAASGPNGVGLLGALLGAGLSYGGALALLMLRPDIRSAPVECIISSALGVSLAFVPYMLARFRRLLTSVLLLGLSASLAAGLMSPRPSSSNAPKQQSVNSSLMFLSITAHPNLFEALTMDGGGIERYGDSLLVVTGDGVFYVITPTKDGRRLTSRRLALPPPLDRKTFLADQEKPDSAPRLRVTDMLLEPGADRWRVFVSHQHWNSPGRCFTMRLSVSELREPEGTSNAANGAWTTLFETWPCLTALPSHDDQTGGRLAWLDGKLLMTVGDHGYDGRNSPAVAQSADNAYGKVLLIDPTGGHEIFTTGHRNPQGLVVDQNQQVWSTEHGPQGGDELNRLEQGRNYGWPLVTYGTDYGRRYWPLSPGARDHGTFTEPVHAFVPSIGISNLIQVRSDLFPEWRGDLLASSLRTKRLHRVRMRGDRVAYVESIWVGREVRDLVEGADGRIFIWSDEGYMVVVAPLEREGMGSAAFGKCRSCHEGAGGEALAPSLSGIIGRRVAASTGYRYSPALAALGGTWTEERLDAFLADPGGFAPGSQMEQGRLPDEAERRALIEFLKTYK
jgi:aldose sugar dehydrogenase